MTSRFSQINEVNQFVLKESEEILSEDPIHLQRFMEVMLKRTTSLTLAHIDLQLEKEIKNKKVDVVVQTTNTTIAIIEQHQQEIEKLVEALQTDIQHLVQSFQKLDKFVEAVSVNMTLRYAKPEGSTQHVTKGECMHNFQHHP